MRLRNVLVLVVALFVLGASSQAAVCELACGPQVAVMQCNAAAHSEAMVMSHGHCSHAMGMASMHGATQSAGESRAGSCGHVSLLVFAKGGSGVVQFSAVQWVLVGVVRVDVMLTGGGVGVGGRPPLVRGGVDPLVVSLRV
jgi:hypothetical protein